MIHAYHLLGNHHHRFDGKFAPTHIKKVFERRSQEVNAEDVVEALLAKVVSIWNAGYRDSRQWIET